jgi:hypothetical protein
LVLGVAVGVQFEAVRVPVNVVATSMHVVLDVERASAACPLHD